MGTRVESLDAVLDRHAIRVDPDRVAQLEAYCRALWIWNQRLNLTRHVTYEKFVTRDLTDSLALAARIGSGARVLDIGTGGGVPGVVLAILRSDLSVALCESVGKKYRAVDAIVTELRLDVAVYHARAENLLASGRVRCDTLVARAVAPLPKLLGWLAPHHDTFQEALIIKGRSWTAECRQARADGLFDKLQLGTISPYQTPGSAAQSVVLQILPRPARAAVMESPDG